MRFPSKITDWHSVLSLFSPTVESELLGMLRPLTGLFCPILDEVSQGLIEPDGIDGLANKGKYHDLLLSEWALLEELPDEFERRSAMNEHLFLNKKKVEQNQRKLSVVLFDVGPNQFGSPKLGQLAILLLLWRRAARAGASFRFGALQANEWLNEDQLYKRGVLRLLKSRHANILGEQNFNFWNGEIEKLETDKLDLWTVSSSRIDWLARRGGGVIIREVPFAQAPALEFTVDAAKQQTKKQRVRLPDPATQIRIVRHPFDEPETPIIPPSTGGRQFAFSMNGRKVLRVADNNYLYVNVLPKKPGQNVKKPQLFKLSGRTVALSNAKSGVIRVIKQDRGYRVIGLPGQGSFDFGDGQNLAIDQRLLFDSMLYMVKNKRGHSVLFMDSKHNLRKLDLTNNSRQLVTIARNVIKLGRVRSINYYVLQKAKQLIITTYIEDQESESNSFLLGAYRHPRVFVHYSGIWHSTSIGCLAYQLADTSWNLVRSNTLAEIEVEPHTQVFGAYASSQLDTDNGAYLVAISPNKKNIILVGEDSVKTVLESEDAIIQAVMNPANKSLAYRTDDKTWRLYSIEHEQVLLDIG